MHAIYTQSALEVLSTAQIKAIAKQIGAIPDGDKRSKQPWIDAIIAHQTAFSPVKVAAMEIHVEAVASRSLAVTEKEEFIASQVLADDDGESQSEAEFERDLTEWMEETECGEDESALEQTTLECGEALESCPVAEKVLNCKSDKKGAATVMAALLVITIVAIRSILIGGCAIVRYAILLGSMFGEYNPDLDLWYRLTQLRRTPTGFLPAT